MAQNILLAIIFEMETGASKIDSRSMPQLETIVKKIFIIHELLF